jgi:SulP family sulfate permease
MMIQLATRHLLPFLAWKSRVSPQNVKLDLIAGLTGAVIVLPQGVAFAMIAGLPPQYGLYTAMITPIIAALFGSSWHLISGPTTAISIVVFSAVGQYATPGSPEFIRLALTLTFLAGVNQLGFGLLRLGSLVNFVSPNVIMGFTSGAALLIAGSQLKHILGIRVPNGTSFLDMLSIILEQPSQVNPYTIVIALVTLLIAIISKFFFPKSPFLLIAMVVGSLTCFGLNGEKHAVSMVGEISAYLPPFGIPDLSLNSLHSMAPKAFAVALLGLIEAVSISRSIANLSGQKVDGNQEFIGQGVSNIVGSFFSSYAGSGSFTRSGINYEAGAKTPLSAIFAAFFLLLILVFMAPLIAYLPVASMGGIILLVAYNLIEFKHIKNVFRSSKTESIVLTITFVTTLLLDLEFAIYSGVLFSLFFYLNRTAKPALHSLVPDTTTRHRSFVYQEKRHQNECPQLKIVSINGSLFFGAVNHIENELEKITSQGLNYKHLLIMGEGINLVDMAGVTLLCNLAKQLKAKGGGLYLIGFDHAETDILKQKRYRNQIGPENIFDSKSLALEAISKRLDPEKCYLCYRSVFQECASKH